MKTIHLLCLSLCLLCRTFVFAQTIEAEKAYLGVKGQCRLQIQYANGSTFTHPLIVAEGFDPGHILEPENRFGQNTLFTFQQSANRSPVLSTRINGSYDIVYVNWVNGTDYLQRNAYALETVIKWVNDQKALSNVVAPNVLLGQSMGGVIARYALKDMENNNEPHQVNLFISHDAPQQGANVPQGLQHLERTARDLWVKTPFGTGGLDRIRLVGNMGINRALNLSDEPAAKQMLMNYVTPSNTVSNTVHDAWQTELETMGYPNGDAGATAAFEKIAIGNGAECGSPQEFGAGDNLLHIQGKTTTRLLGELLAPLATNGFLATAYLTGQPSFLLGILPGRNEFNVTINVNAQADGVSNQVFNSNITYKKNLLYIIPINSTLNNRVFNSSASTLPVDHYPGGFYLNQFNLQGTSFQNAFASVGLTATMERTFNFVPTVSALDIGSGTITLTKSDYQIPYVGSAPPTGAKSSPFNRFITDVGNQSISSSRNEEHITFNPRNGNWLDQELQGQNGVAPNCEFSCNNAVFSISGPASFCTSQVYSIANLPTGVNVTWTTTPSTVVNRVVNSDQSVTLTKVTDADFQLSATLSTPCGASAPITKSVKVGFPPFTGSMNGPTSVFKNASYNYSVTLPSGLTGTKTWIVSSGWSVTSGQGTNQAIILTGTTNGSVTFRITNCGISRDLFKNVTVDGGGTPLRTANAQVDTTGMDANSLALTMIKVTPNPAHDILNVSLSISAVSTESIQIVRISDAAGRIKRELKCAPGTLQQSISLSGFSKGMYVVNIFTGSQWLHEKVMIQ